MRNPLPILSGLQWMMLILAAGTVGVVLLWSQRAPSPAPETHAVSLPSIPLPEYSKTPYRNVDAAAHYIGSAACAQCHRANEASYRRTAHSRAFSDVDPAREPPDGTFTHAASGRVYRVYRRDGQLRHEEITRSADGKEITRQDFPVRYLVGSGRFSRTYLLEVDGFLHESPITWYASKHTWDMSPGYDARDNWGFERAVEVRCLACHSGRVEEAGAVHRLTFHEKAIGCENCHGPGSLHQSLRPGERPERGEGDVTIVHPAKASRTIVESICGACHASGVAAIELRGRQPGEFRPGRPLSDYRVHYQFSGAQAQMTVVGHVEQLHLSACYRKSERMTCVTCHDPHEREAVADVATFYRNKCLECHDKQPCALEESKRREKADNCSACHMPRGDTDIPHIAFTHHRIGIHGSAPASTGRSAAPELVEVDAAAGLSALDRQRNLGLAYAELYKNPQYARDADAFRKRARENLETVYAAGLRDGETLSQLAELHAHANEYERAGTLARETLTAPECSLSARARALLVLADTERERGDLSAAIDHLEQATRLRRSDDNWRILGMGYLENGQFDKAMPALQQALSIRPNMPDTHFGLAELYRRLGNTPLAEDHRAKGQWLLNYQSK